MRWILTWKLQHWLEDSSFLSGISNLADPPWKKKEINVATSHLGQAWLAQNCLGSCGGQISLGEKPTKLPVAAPGEFPGCSPHLEMCRQPQKSAAFRSAGVKALGFSA